MKATVRRKLPDAPEPTRAYHEVEIPPRFSDIQLWDPKMKGKDHRRGRGEDKEQREHRKQWKQEDIDKMLRLYREGNNLRTIARILQRSEGNVHTRLTKELGGKR